MDNRSFMILGKANPATGGLVWFDDILRRDTFKIGDVVYLAGKAYRVMHNAYERNGHQFVDVSDAHLLAGLIG